MTDFPLDYDAVNDFESFEKFLWALVEDREKADVIERENPERYSYDGANGWHNGTISSFLSAAMASGAFEKSTVPTWRDLAYFLYMGKDYE